MLDEVEDTRDDDMKNMRGPWGRHAANALHIVY
jgi:hypothetical protein